MVDKYDYKVKDEKAFGKIICSANSQEDESTLNTEKPCIFEIVPKGMTTDKRTDVWYRPSCIYTQTFSPKKTGFPSIKILSIFFFDFCLPLFYATFQCGP